MANTSDSLADRLLEGIKLLSRALTISISGCSIRINSNSLELLETLTDYFHPFLTDQNHRTANISIVAIQSAEVHLDYDFVDWRREPGKKGRKDACYDLEDGRLIQKVRSGMLFLQSQHHQIATGPCLQYPNQVINFINAQYMNQLQQHGWQICHAAAVVYDKQAFAIAGFSGGGKSTTLLNLLENDQLDFLTNDRLFIRKQNGEVSATGIAKFPRINPGTIVNNSRLHDLIPTVERERLLVLPKQVLWQLEDKYDVDIENLYGSGRIAVQASLQVCFILNWEHDSNLPLSIRPVDLADRSDLLKALTKSPGPFFQDNNGRFIADTDNIDVQTYLSTLSSVKVYEMYGKIDFTAIQQILLNTITMRQP